MRRRSFNPLKRITKDVSPEDKHTDHIQVRRKPTATHGDAGGAADSALHLRLRAKEHVLIAVEVRLKKGEVTDSVGLFQTVIGNLRNKLGPPDNSGGGDATWYETSVNHNSRKLDIWHKPMVFILDSEEIAKKLRAENDKALKDSLSQGYKPTGDLH